MSSERVDHLAAAGHRTSSLESSSVALLERHWNRMRSTSPRRALRWSVLWRPVPLHPRVERRRQAAALLRLVIVEPSAASPRGAMRAVAAAHVAVGASRWSAVAGATRPKVSLPRSRPEARPRRASVSRPHLVVLEPPLTCSLESGLASTASRHREARSSGARQGSPKRPKAMVCPACHTLHPSEPSRSAVVPKNVVAPATPHVAMRRPAARPAVTTPVRRPEGRHTPSQRDQTAARRRRVRGRLAQWATRPL